MLILLFLAAGILAGFLLRGHAGLLGAADRLSALSVCLLVFLLGLAVGSNAAVIRNLGPLGLRAAVLSLAGVLGSVLAARLVFWLRAHAE
ncbi:MAG: LysO family transporter [Candidatus Methylomirabilales bacterium]